MTNQIAVETARPSNTAFEKAEPQLRKAPRYPCEKERFAEAFSCGGKGASMVMPPTFATMHGRAVFGKKRLRRRAMSITRWVSS